MKTQESVSELHGRKKLEDVYYGSGKTYQLRAIYAMILLSYISEYLVQKMFLRACEVHKIHLVK